MSEKDPLIQFEHLELGYGTRTILRNITGNINSYLEKAGLRIIQFRSNEIKNQIQIVKSIVDNATGKTSKKIHARKCRVKLVNAYNAREFLKQNHI